MTLPQLLSELAQRKIQLSLNADKLRIDAPKGSLTPELKAALAHYKSTLIDSLKPPISNTLNIALHRAITAQAQQRPDAVAVVALDGALLSYQQLEQHANQVAHALKQHGIQAGDQVGLCTHTCSVQIIGLLAILKLGAECVPWQADFYLAHTQQFLCQQVKLLLTAAPVLAKLPTHNTPMLVLDELDMSAYPDTDPSDDRPAHGAAYRLYSSETLAISITHQDTFQRLNWLQQLYPISADDVVLHHTTLHRDVGFWEIFWPLMHGAQLVLHPDLNTLATSLQVLSHCHITVVLLTPNVLNVLTQQALHLPQLRQVIASGQTLYQNKAQAFLTAYPHAALCHVFTSPEAESTLAFQCQADSMYDCVPLALSAHTDSNSVLILDRFKNPVPLGVVGELYLQARQQDYVQAAYLSAQHFMPNPLKPPHRLFRTYKRARWLSSTHLELLGGTGRQAWVQGIRVNLSTVEALLLREPSVSECVVLMRQSSHGESLLVAYVVCNSVFISDRLQQHLQQHVSTVAQLPYAYVPLTSLPFTATGAIDEAILQRIPVLETELTQQLEQLLLSRTQGQQYSVAQIQMQPLSESPLHLDDVLPQRQSPLALADHTQNANTTSLDSAMQQAIAARPLAFSDGGELLLPADAPLTMSEALLRTAQRFPEKGIIYADIHGEEDRQTYAELVQEAQQILAGLQAHGLQAGDRVILQVVSLRDHFSSFWGCVLGGIIPVTVAIAPTYRSKNAVVSKLYNIWQLLEYPPLLTSQSLVNELQQLPPLFDCPMPTTLAVEHLKQAPQAAVLHAVQPDDIMFYQLSSGSTGVPKCIQERHYSLVCHVHGSQQFNAYRAEHISLNWLPRDHVVPLLTYHLKDTYLGCEQIQLKTEQVLNDPLWWLSAIERYRVTHSWAPNFGFKLVSDCLKQLDTPRQWDLSCMQLLMNAGEQVTRLVVQDFLAETAAFGITPEKIQPAFGMAEVCTCMTYHNDFSLSPNSIFRMSKASLDSNLIPTHATDNNGIDFVHLGPPMRGVQIRIADEHNQTVSEGVIGRFQIRGEVVTNGYLKNPSANAEAFVGDGWFNSGDLGFILNGKLTLTGRLKEMIVVRGANFYCYEIEDVVNEVEGVAPTFTGVCAVEDVSGGTEGLAVFFVPKQFEGVVSAEVIELISRIKTQVSQVLGIAPAVVVPMRLAEFPKTTSGKIQRAQLKQRLAAGEFQDLIRRLDIAQSNANTLPDCFYRTVWQTTDAYTQHIPHQLAATLLFTDSVGLGAQLCEQLAHQCICVSLGTQFQCFNPYHYQLSPSNFEHYSQLFTFLNTAGVTIGRIVHLWSYELIELDEPAKLTYAQQIGADSVRYLVQALTANAPPRDQPLPFFVVSRQAQSVLAQESPNFIYSLLPALVRTLAQEVPWLSVRHIDLGNDALTVAMRHLQTELNGAQAHVEVAWRQQQRRVPRLEKVSFNAPVLSQLPLRKEGFYVISGGLGGVAAQVIEHLLNQQALNLLLVGRRSQAQFTETQQRRYRHLQHLAQQRDSQLHYAQADITQFSEMQDLIHRQQQQWQVPLIGAWHLAGVYQEALLTEMSDSAWQQVLAPKLQGAWVLHRLLAAQPSPLFVHFSSVLSHFSGAMIGAYACANRALESFAHYQRQQGIDSYCLSWSTWHEQGMSEGYSGKAVLQARGIRDLSPTQALHALNIALLHGLHQVQIGLDGTQAFLRGHRLMPCDSLQKLLVYAEAEHMPSTFNLWDRFGTPVYWDVVKLPVLPRTAQGEIDRTALTQLSDAQQGQHIAPRNAVEQQLVELWQHLLKVPEIGVEDNFFQLGGHSLLAMHLMSQVQTQFGVNLPLSALFEQATVAHLAHLISSEQPINATHPSLITLQPQGKQTPFFCVAGLSGSALYLQTLAQSFAPHRPFHSFQATGLSDATAPLTTVEALAEQYLTALRTQQAHGPYCLGGHSFGGYIAFEMAQRLQAAGETVQQLVIMDIQAPVARLQTEATLETDALAWIHKLTNMLSHFSGRELSLDYMALAQLNEAERLQRLVTVLQQAEVLHETTELTQIQSILNVFRANTEAYYQYQAHAPWQGNITLLRCETVVPSRDLTVEPAPFDLHWQALCHGVLRVEVVSGEHFSMMNQPHVQHLAECLLACLE